MPGACEGSRAQKEQVATIKRFPKNTELLPTRQRTLSHGKRAGSTNRTVRRVTRRRRRYPISGKSPSNLAPSRRDSDTMTPSASRSWRASAIASACSLPC